MSNGAHIGAHIKKSSQIISFLQSFARILYVFLGNYHCFFSRAKSKQSPGSGSGEKLSAHSLRISKKAPGSQVLFGFQRFPRFCKKHHSKLRILCKMPHGRRSGSTSGSCAGTGRRAHSGAYRKKRSHLQKGFCTWPYVHRCRNADC